MSGLRGSGSAYQPSRVFCEGFVWPLSVWEIDGWEGPVFLRRFFKHRHRGQKKWVVIFKVGATDNLWREEETENEAEENPKFWAP
jgi:hypothetical protein